MRTEWHATGRLRAAMPPPRRASRCAWEGCEIPARSGCPWPRRPAALCRPRRPPRASWRPAAARSARAAAGGRACQVRAQLSTLVPGTAAAAHCPVLIPRPPPTRFLWVLFNSAAASLASRPRAGQPSRTPCARRCARATARNSRHAPPVWARRPPTPKGQVGWFVHKGPFAPFWNCACVL